MKTVSPALSGRVHFLNAKAVPPSGHTGGGPVVYWMHREHRVRDNWGLIHAQQCALDMGAPLVVVWCMAPGFLDAGLRQFAFLLRGLEEVRSGLNDLSIPFALLKGDPGKEIAAFAKFCRARLIVTDFDPQRIKRRWVGDLLSETELPVRDVDSRNVVPCREASDKREYAARTIRPKIHRLLPDYLGDFPALQAHPHGFGWGYGEAEDRTPLSLLRELGTDAAVPGAPGEVTSFTPGEAAAGKMLDAFIDERLHDYAEGRNDPNRDSVSMLSPYLHFGMISVQRAVLEVTSRGRRWPEAVDGFVEQAVVRRELAENFCMFCPDYDSAASFNDWARESLDRHRNDPRDHVYEAETFERAETHDPLWNAAQMQMVRTGYMHNYMRMYWCKKILEWTPSPEDAMRIAVYLNDRYELDGRDPNGYTGIAWSVGGVHDRPWKERPVFGSIRFMNDRGAARKFDVKQYIATHLGGSQLKLL